MRLPHGLATDYESDNFQDSGNRHSSTCPTAKSRCGHASSSVIPSSHVSRWSCTSQFLPQIILDRTELSSSDVLHPNRPNVSKDELRTKLSELYKANKEAVSVFGFRTQYGGGKSTGFALIYESQEAMKKFEPHYRLVRYGMAKKVDKSSRQQRKQRKNRAKELRGTAKTKGAKKGKKE